MHVMDMKKYNYSLSNCNENKLCFIIANNNIIVIKIFILSIVNKLDHSRKPSDLKCLYCV